MQPTIKIIILPSGFWCLEVDGEKSKSAPYEEPIFFRGYVATSDYYDAAVYQIARALPAGEFEVKDETI